MINLEKANNGNLIINTVLKSKITYFALVLAIFLMGFGLYAGIDLILKDKIFPSLLIIFGGIIGLPIMLFRFTWNIPSAIFFTEEKINFIYSWGKSKEYLWKDIMEMKFSRQGSYYMLEIETEKKGDYIGAISQEITTKLKELR